MAQYKVYLGDITIEIPPEKKIDFTSGHEIAKIDIPGKSPDYQPMGPIEKTCKWNGLFEEDNALKKALAIEALADKGNEIKFLYADISMQVMIRSFNFQYYHETRVCYDIELIAKTNIQAQTVNQVIQPTTTHTSSQANSNSGTQDAIVQQGDNLRSISSQAFGTPHEWQAIAMLNGLDGSVIPDGVTTIKVPLKDQLSNIKAKQQALLNQIPALDLGGL